MTEPLVSVITPAFNASRFIGETIESVLGQTHENLEMIVADGGSTDETVEIVERYAKGEDRVRLIRGPDGSGPWMRRNLALKQSRGSLICSLDADDLWLPQKVERQVEVMSERPELGLVYTYFEAFDSDTGEALSWSDARHDWQGDLLVPLWVKGCFIGAQTMMIRREALDDRTTRLGNERFQFGDDYWIQLAVALKWPVARIDEALVRYRRHDQNESTRFAEANAYLWLNELMREFLEEFPEARSDLGSWRRIGLARNYAYAARMERARGSRGKAGWHKMRAIRLDPRRVNSDPALDAKIERRESRFQAPMKHRARSG